MILGCIADDFTGATDLANTLVKEGMRVIQMIGVPDTDAIANDADAVVVALKSRSTPAHEAVADSMAALQDTIAAGMSFCARSPVAAPPGAARSTIAASARSDVLIPPVRAHRASRA